MYDFTYHNTTEIIFGRDAEKNIGSRCAGRKILLVMGGGSIKSNGVYDKVTASLKSAGVEYDELWGVKPNPRVSKVREGIEAARNGGIGLILAVGGGSVIDTAKAIAMGSCYGGDVWDFFTKKAAPKEALPVGVVLTISAAGSECSMTSVISNEDTDDKLSCSAPCILPAFAVMNPENLFSLPPYQTACGAADMLAHLMERYFVTTPCVDLTDRLIEGAAQTVIEFAPKAMSEPDNYDVRAELMWTGCIAHCDILDRGRSENSRGGDWSSHQLEHMLSAYYDIAHGAGLAIIFPAWIRFVRRIEKGKLVQFAKRVFHIDGADDDAVIDLLLERLESFYRSLGLPVRLSEVNIGDEHFAEMAEKAVKSRNGALGKYVRLSVSDAEEIYRLAL